MAVFAVSTLQVLFISVCLTGRALGREKLAYNHMRRYENSGFQQAIECIEPGETHKPVFLQCSDPTYIRVKDVIYGRLPHHDETFCKKPRVQNRVRNCFIEAEHSIIHEVVSECALKPNCRPQVYTAVATSALRDCGFRTGPMYVVVEYVCKGKMPDGDVHADIPIHEIGTTPDQLHPQPIIYIVSPDYGRFTDVVFMNCSLDYVLNPGERPGNYKFGIEYTDFYSNLDVREPVPGEHPHCTYKSGLYNIDRPLGYHFTDCPETYIDYVYHGTHVGITLEKQQEKAVGRLWIMAEVGLREGNDDTFLRRAPAGIKVKCDMHNGKVESASTSKITEPVEPVEPEPTPTLSTRWRFPLNSTVGMPNQSTKSDKSPMPAGVRRQDGKSRSGTDVIQNRTSPIARPNGGKRQNSTGGLMVDKGGLSDLSPKLVKPNLTTEIREKPRAFPTMIVPVIGGFIIVICICIIAGIHWRKIISKEQSALLSYHADKVREKMHAHRYRNIKEVEASNVIDETATLKGEHSH